MLKSLPDVELVKKMDAFEIAEFMWGFDAYWEVFQNVNANASDEFVKFVNEASVNPFFRAATYEGELSSTDKLCLLKTVAKKSEPAYILKHLHNINKFKMDYLCKVYVLDELILLNKLAKNSVHCIKTVTVKTDSEPHSDVTSVTLFDEERLRVWFLAYLDYFQVADELTKELIYTGRDSFVYYWEYLRELYGMGSSFAVMHLSVNQYVSKYPPHLMGDFSVERDWKTFSFGSDQSYGLVKELETIQLALQARDAGRETFLIDIDPHEFYNPNSKGMCRLAVSDVLDKWRLSSMVDGYIAYLKEKYTDDDKRDSQLQWYLSQFPEQYLRVFDFLTTEVATPIQRLVIIRTTLKVNSDNIGLADMINALPRDWKEMSVDDLTTEARKLLHE